jgi:hypothetical protein
MNRFTRLAVLSIRSGSRGLHLANVSTKFAFRSQFQIPFNSAIRSFGDHAHHDGHHGDGEGEVSNNESPSNYYLI